MIDRIAAEIAMIRDDLRGKKLLPNPSFTDLLTLIAVCAILGLPFATQG